MSGGVKSSQWIGPHPMLWLGIGITLAALPLMLYLPFWLPLWTVGLTIWRVSITWRQRPLPSPMARWTALGAGLGLVLLTHGPIIKTDAAVGLLSVLVGLKLLELRTRRDFLVAMFIGFFLVLSTCFYESSFGTTLFLLLPSTCLLAGALQVSAGRLRPMRWHRAVFATWRMMALALPLTVLLFLFFPRMQGHFIQLGSSKVGVTGISDQVYPGSLTRISMSRELAFRAELEGAPPPPVERYWRGLVLLDCRGMAWNRGKQERAATRLVPADTPLRRQRITLEPHNRKWLFALDRPVLVPYYDTMFATQTFEDNRVVTRLKQYDVASSMKRVPRLDTRSQLTRALQVNYQPGPRVAAYVAQLKKKHGDDAKAIAASVLAAFANGFTYTLNPGDYRSRDPMAEFFFERRVGFCEHFAATFATLMRLAGVPSRLVIGYQGGEINRHGKYLQVRQSDAHAWAEIWLEGEGWSRIDPTSVVAPSRLELGMNRFVEEGGESQGPAGAQEGQNISRRWNWWREFTLNLRDGWDNLDYQWVLLVMDYDQNRQQTLLQEMGARPGREWLWATGGMVGSTAAAVTVLAFLLLRRTRSRDPVRRAAERFCRLVEPAGGPREEWEPLTRYVERIAERLPEPVAREARHFAREHAEIRYGPTGDTTASTLQTHLQRLKDSLRQSQ